MADKYLENFDAKLLNISLTKGDIQVNHLSINPNALKDLHPCLTIERGSIGSVHVKYSLIKIKTEPIIVHVEDVFILVSSKDTEVLSQEEVIQGIKDKLLEKL